MTTYKFHDTALMARACEIVSAGLPDAVEYGAIDQASADRVEAAMLRAAWVGEINLDVHDLFAFVGCFHVQTEENIDWSDEDYAAVMDTMGN